MPMYTFQLRKPDGVPLGLEACELDYDGETFSKAGELLDQHLSCDHVEIWDGDRAVVARHREQPIIRRVVTAEA